MMRYLIVLTVWGGFLQPLQGYGQELPFVHYTPEGDLHSIPSAEVHKVYQDRLGYLWMAVYSSGLVRYDGTAMDLFTTDDGLKDLALWDMLEDPLGRLWIGSNSGLVVSEKPLAAYAEGERIRFTASIGQTPLLSTGIRKNAVAVDQEGWLWTGTDRDGLIRYRIDPSDAVSDTIPTVIDPVAGNASVRSMIVRRDGSVWVGVRGGAILVFEKGTPRFDVISQEDGAPHQSVYTFYESEDGTLWLGTWTGELLKVEEKEGTRSIVPVSTAQQNAIVSIVAAWDGALWAASQGSGLLKLDLAPPGQRVLYTRKNGLLGENLHHVMQDREGNLWFAQSGGVSKLRANYAAFENLTAESHVGEQPVLSAPSVASVVLPEDPADPCRLWAATSEGGLVCVGEDGRRAYVQHVHGLRSDRVNGLAYDRAGRLWIGTFKGINSLTLDPAAMPAAAEQHWVAVLDRRARLAGHGEGGINAVVNLVMPGGSPTEASFESLWFPGISRLYGLIEETWYLFGEASGLPSTELHAVAYDGEGRLWVGTRDHGIYRSTRHITPDVLKEPGATAAAIWEGTQGREVVVPFFEPYWGTAKGAPTNQIETMVWREGAMWVGTPEGLFVFDGNPLQVTTRLTQEQGLKARNAISMAFSPVSGSLWVGTNRGLAEVDPQTRTVRRTITKQDGLVDNEVWFFGSVAVGHDGTVYFGTAKGIALYRPDADRLNRVAPLLRIRNATYTEDQKGHNEIILEYSALSFMNERQVRYKTRLLGYETAWSEEKTDNKIRYTNLPAYLSPKAYTLQVLASNNQGLWMQEPLAYTFTVRPAWWTRWWAFVLYLIVLSAGVFAVDRFQRARLIRKERQRASLREAELRAEAAELQARALQAENERKQLELEKSRELEWAYQRVRAKNEQLEQSHTIVAAINAETSFRRLLRTILEQARVMPGVEKAMALVYDPQREAFLVRAGLGWDMEQLAGLQMTPEAAAARYVSGAEEVAEDIFVAKDGASLPGAAPLAAPGRVASLLVLRVQVQGRVEGYLVFDNLTNRDAFVERDVALLEGLREHIRSAFIKTRLLEDLHAKNEEISVQRAELQTALDHLKATQAQLVQAEKMASLGQLTAGIAHEIKNPLNFVNNFAELNVELVGELREALRKLDRNAGVERAEELEALIDDILGNTEQVVKHGQRADRIVKGMMLHTRGGTGEREYTDLNALVEEYLNLAYHGVRATQPGFNVTLDRSYDPAVGRVLVVPQEIGRVLLNLLNNAFYAVYERQARANGQYAPTVTVRTRCTGAQVEIRVQDNGTGIPATVRARIFEPFFTTKPSGEGTGLGLSLSYDIVTHGHGGALTVESEEGRYTAFSVRLPRSASATGQAAPAEAADPP